MTYEEAKKMFVAGKSTTKCKVKKELYELAIAALEKQNPQTTIYHFGEYLCKVCGAVVEHTKYNRYCQHCGQALDWSEEDE